jgi:hypothetical protein
VGDEIQEPAPDAGLEIETGNLTIRTFGQEVELSRRVRIRVLQGAAVMVPIGIASGFLLGEDVWRNPVLVGIWFVGILAMIRAFVYPLNHTHILRPRTSPREVLAAGGLPEPAEGSALSEWDRRLAILDLIDQLDSRGPGFWSSRLGRLVARWAGWVGAALWLGFGVVVAVVFGWAEATMGLVPALVFGAAAWFGERDRRRRAEAIRRLQDQLDALSVSPGSDADRL